MDDSSWHIDASVDGQPVEAMWEKGTLSCSPQWRTRVETLIRTDRELMTEFGPILSTLDGSSAHVLVTFIRAADRVISAEVLFALDGEEICIGTASDAGLPAA